MKTVLVTGATGFIGRHVLEPLVRKGFDVHGVYRAKIPENIPDKLSVTWHKANLLNGNDINNVFGSVSPACLLHLAWDVTPGSYLESTNNFNWLNSSLHLLREFAESGGVRAVCAGTCIEYDVRYGYCIENLTPTAPSTYYGSCKHYLQSIGEKYADKMCFEFAWGRIFQPYGPYEYPARLVPSVILSLLKDEPARCTHGDQVRDFLYIADVADAFVALLDSEVTGNVNIGSGEPVSIKEMVIQIAQCLGKEDDVQFGAFPERENEPPFMVADTGRLKKEVQWRRRYSLEKGVMETISWWEKRGVQE